MKKRVDKYLALKIVSKENQSLKSNDDLHAVALAASVTATHDRDDPYYADDTQMTPEAHAINMKMLRKQKARIIHFQNLLSRNTILIPLCLLFSLCSTVSIFAATLTDHYEYIIYDINKFKSEIVLENSLQLRRLLNVAPETVKLNTTLDNNITFQTYSDYSTTYITATTTITSSNTRNLTKSQNQSSQSHLPSTTTSVPKFVPFYELTVIADEVFIVTRRNYLSADNSSLKTDMVFATYSGIWRRCNYLSSNTVFSPLN